MRIWLKEGHYDTVDRRLGHVFFDATRMCS